MNKAKNKQWRRTSPLAAIFYVGKIFKTIAQNAVQSFAPLVAFLFAFEGDLMSRIVLGASAFTIIIVLLSFVRYWFFRYRITDDSVFIREGVLKKTQLDIKFDRIQAINTKQNIVYRQFDLVTVELDTAGSSKQEGSLPAIKSELAESLKTRLRSERSPDSGAESDIRTDSRPILQLHKGDMIRIGLSSRQALLFLVLLGPLWDKIGSRVEQLVDENTVLAMLQGAGISIAGGIGLAIAAWVLFMFLLALASITGAFLRYFRFELRAEEDTLRSTGGLLTRHEHSINLKKIQSLRAVQNPILQFFKRYRLRAKQASSGRASKGKQFVIPVCDRNQLPQIEAQVFGEEFPDIDLLPKSASFQRISRSYIRSRFLLFGLIPSAAITFLYSFLIGLYALIFLLWIPMCLFGVWTHYRKFGYAIAENGVVLRSGFIGYQTTAFLHRKVQRISVTQTLLQERKGLATIRFYLASGSLRLPYVDRKMAMRIRDYILYKIESSQLAWH